MKPASETEEDTGYYADHKQPAENDHGLRGMKPYVAVCRSGKKMIPVTSRGRSTAIRNVFRPCRGVRSAKSCITCPHHLRRPAFGQTVTAAATSAPHLLQKAIACLPLRVAREEKNPVRPKANHRRSARTREPSRSPRCGYPG